LAVEVRVDGLLGGRQVQRHAPIREQVASILRDAIIEMRLAPGQLLIERELCEMTQASRPSVREALRQLEAEGLVESLSGRGTIVSTASPELATQVMEVRVELERLAIELFIKNASDDDIAAFRDAVAEVRATLPESGDATAMGTLRAVNRVYEVLLAGAGNPMLTQMVNMLQRRVNQVRAVSLEQPGRATQNLIELEAMLDSLERRDVKSARSAAAFHVQQEARVALAALADAATVRTKAG
jgi:DNA-binding GntR family transcriptional regulator